MTSPAEARTTMKSSSEARSQVAAAAASVIPFHCIICFDEFNLTDRPPVVLPCGHTYVCQPCSKRLRRCMECREPLFMTTSVPKSPPVGRASHQHGRYSPHHPSTPPQAGTVPPAPGNSSSVQVALPMPKNVVLMAMMEAAHRHGNKDETETSDGEEDEEEEFDLNRIISGMSTLSGPCGTYAVREPDGLAVMPFDPRKQDRVEGQDEKKTENEDGPPREPYRLERGQTAQIVRFEDGVAKLAREEGYIVATSSQLVKVGGPKDKSCRLEGLLDTVSNRGHDLQRTLDENQDIEVNLRKQIHAERDMEPTYPIITDPPKKEEPTTPNTIQSDPLSQEYVRTPESSEPHDVFIMQTNSLEVEPRTYGIGGNTVPAGSPSPRSIDNSEIDVGHSFPAYRRNNSADELNQMAFGCGAAFFGGGLGGDTTENLQLEAANDENRNTSGTGSSHDARSTVSDSSTTEPPWLQSAPVLTSSFDTVDFRTGLSGHRGLTSKTAHAGSPTFRRPTRMLMSVHSGIGRASARRPRAASGETTLGPRFHPLRENEDA